MNRFIKAALVALALGATAAPFAAQAQHYDRSDRREWRDDRRDDRREWRSDRREDRRDWRHDRRDDRRDWRHEVRNDHRFDRNNRHWYRGRSDFRDYRGVRPGYWYAPSYGYYRVDPRHANYRWHRGSYLPRAYHSYYVSDPYIYGLRPAPRGYRYVHAGSDIVMIAVATGLIASVFANMY